jgi:hypothetical protein
MGTSPHPLAAIASDHHRSETRPYPVSCPGETIVSASGSWMARKIRTSKGEILLALIPHVIILIL